MNGLNRGQFWTQAIACKTLYVGILAYALMACAPVKADEAAIRQALSQRLPKEMVIDSVQKSPVAGLFEVRLGNEIVYTDETGKFLIVGTIQDIQTGKNFTQDRVDALAVAAVYEPNNLKNALKLVKGNGKRQLVVFEDANCGYCKKLRTEMEKLNDVTIYTYLIPILSEDSARKAQAVWCAADRNKAYDDWMLRGVTPPAADGRCAAPIEANMSLAQSLKINGTPAIFFANGRRVPGYVEFAQLEASLSEK